MKCRVMRIVVAWACVLLLTAAAPAQDVPFQGIVTQDDTKVLSGAGRAYYVVGELDQGAAVQVEDVLFGWNKIVPPVGVYSYISKMNVQRRGSGDVGFVSVDGADVFAANLKGPGESYRKQLSQPLKRGDRVEIVGEEGSFYKIKPPKGAFVFIAPGTVRRAHPGEVAAPPRDPAPAPAPEAPREVSPAAPEAQPEPVAPPVPSTPAPEPEPGTTPPAGLTVTPVPPPAIDAGLEPPAPAVEASPAASSEGLPPVEGQRVADAAAGSDATTAQQQASLEAMVHSRGAQSAAVSDKLKALEERMMPEFTKPLEEQPIGQMIREYEAMQSQPLPAVDRQIVRMRLAALRKNQGIADTLKSIREAQKDLTTTQQVEEVLSEGPVRYDAVGRLQASSVYNGRNLPLRFRLIDPASGRTIMWIQPDSAVEPRRHLGRVVGLVGAQEYDPGVKTNVLIARRIDILEPAAEAEPR